MRFLNRVGTVALVLGVCSSVVADEKTPWRDALLDGLAAQPAATLTQLTKTHPQHRSELAVIADWVSQDNLAGPGGLQSDAVRRVIDELGSTGATLQTRLDKLATAKVAPTDRRWAELYLDACEQRRSQRLAIVRKQSPQIVFTKHYDFGGSHYAYTEGQSDAQAERKFEPGASLCVLKLDGTSVDVRTLLDDRKGVIRDPDVSYDGKRILFSWKKSLNEDDYHLYEMDVATKKTRQITEGLGFADYEGAYLPNGDIVFNSSRCVQTVDCWWTEVSNLYTCDADGKYLRRLAFDQVHSNYPTVTWDGRVIYTRWEYSDRGQLFPQPLFEMSADGTGQQELYGNSSWFPTSILHARAIPGTNKVVGIFSGHHTRQRGLLGIIDPTKGRQENDGAQLIAPVRETKAVRVDRFGQEGDQFQYPYPLSETEFLVAFRPEGTKHFGIYLMTEDARRELLTSDASISCNQCVPVASRPIPPMKRSPVDYKRETAEVYMHDVYAGDGLKGVERGTIKSLRVVAIEHRAAGVGHNGNRGPAGGALVSTPISIQGAWDVKKVLGTASVHEDGSAYFSVPARTPIYLQALDAKGHAVQSMRSWMTLQPGERMGCVGCHDNKNAAPPAARKTYASTTSAETLKPWQNKPPTGFSFVREIQPILDARCISCHFDESKNALADAGPTFDPKTMRWLMPAQQKWRHTLDEPAREWNKAYFDDSKWKEAPGGFGTKGTPGARIGTTWRSKDVWLRRTIELAQTPSAPALYVHHDEDVEIFINGVKAANAKGYTTKYEMIALKPKAVAALVAGKNTIAVHCRQTGGGQFIDVALVETGVATKVADAGKQNPLAAFSLKGTQRFDPQALRKWSDSYKALANRKVANWIQIQSGPEVLPPYHAGASQSRLIEILEAGHYDVKLTPEEMDRFVTWIDLLVPYCGDYREGLEGDNLAKYQHFLDKRLRWIEREEQNIAEWIRDRQGER